jgi:branched-subunit amino acid aminotransferase/4-amino-4-deoxychorismate lyase
MPAAEARIPVWDAGVAGGVIVSEQIRTFLRRLYRLDDHLDRLAASLSQVGLGAELKCDDLARTAVELVAHNAGLLPTGQELGLAIFVTAGEISHLADASDAAGHAGPTVCMHTFSLPFERWAHKMHAGARLVVSPVQQVPASCIAPSIKHRSRLHYYLAERAARTIDPDAIPLLLDRTGHAMETPTANILIVDSSGIVSPPIADILPGISRVVVKELATSLGIYFSERALSVESIASASEVLMSSTPFCLMPVTHLDGRLIGEGTPGPVFHRLMEAWSRTVGVDILEQIRQGAQARQGGLRGTATG